MKRHLLLTLVCVCTSACTPVGYYLHLVRGQSDLLDRRVLIADLLADPATDPGLKSRLQLVLEARAFAVSQLQLPDNGSYRSYSDLARPYALWNVFAAPEFSLTAHEWCYPLVGCLAYRGYYTRERADESARALKDQGLDVFVAGVAAYSSLGWFDDPLLNTMLVWNDERLLQTLFHELAHQRSFIKGDTAFNESYASFVGEEGLRAFRNSRGEPPPDEGAAARQDQFIDLVLKTRERLQTLYASGQPPELLRAGKRAEVERLHAGYQTLRASWGGDAGFDRWFEGEINNAKLLPIGLYRRWVPAFAALFKEQGGNWLRFYAEVDALGMLELPERNARLEQLSRSVPVAGASGSR